ncbi:hypothetical protein GTW51_10005 [Aurantimonas aggregata]|uniref:Uncharacterized protein n=1 Tax=Aurantimonas aggregata TaxID=2047720 RepID=A0A6L9MGT4_9HYPH|nr:hypothetical protein [Aurantimonas aggregata]NDV87034.1 hypothetical protein [Aurantimonas aggregata]
MAIKVVTRTDSGEERELYIRLNNFDTLSKHAPSVVIFRGFISQEAFERRFEKVWERVIEFEADLSKGADRIGLQAYEALTRECPEFADALEV